MQIRGYDLAQAELLGNRIQKSIEDLPGIEGVRVGRNTGQPQTDLHLDRDKLAELGLSVRDVASVIQVNVGGGRAGSYRIGGEEFPIIVQLRPEDRRTTQSLSNIPLRLPDGGIIPISSVIDAQSALGPPRIFRIDGQRITEVTASLAEGIPLGEAVEAIRERVADIAMPPGFSIYFGGEVEEQQKEQEREQRNRRKKMFTQVLELDNEDTVACYGLADILFAEEPFSLIIFRILIKHFNRIFSFFLDEKRNKKVKAFN